MKPLANIGPAERDVVEQRRRSGYRSAGLAHFHGDREPVLRSLLDLLLPGVPETIDLAAFVDDHLTESLGRGDRRAGLPATPSLLVDGVAALAAEGFAGRTPDAQRDLIGQMRRGDRGEQAKEFVDRLLDKALMGFLAHPDTWDRIGFNGPAYPQGYAWIGPAEVAARHDHKPGWDKL